MSENGRFVSGRIACGVGVEVNKRFVVLETGYQPVGPHREETVPDQRIIHATCVLFDEARILADYLKQAADAGEAMAEEAGL